MTWGALFERAPDGISPAAVSDALAERRAEKGKTTGERETAGDQETAGKRETAEERETAADDSSDRESTGGEG